MPRVLTGDEIKNRMTFESEGFTWIEESRNGKRCVPAVVGPVEHGVTLPDGSGFLDEVKVLSLSDGNAVMTVFVAREYGETWRCWTTRPTDEERKNTPWSDAWCDDFLTFFWLDNRKDVEE